MFRWWFPESKCLSMPVLHALTGCDTTSAFWNKGKRIHVANWTKNPWFSDVPVDLATNTFKKITADSDEFKNIEKFVSKLYSAEETSVNNVRKSMFCHTTQDLRRLPPTRDALLQHCKRMIYQGGVWTQAHDAQCVPPSPEEYGWRKEASGTWSPLWIALDTITNATKELLKCACKKVCTSCKSIKWWHRVQTCANFSVHIGLCRHIVTVDLHAFTIKVKRFYWRFCNIIYRRI